MTQQQPPLELIDIYGVWYHPWWQQAWFKYGIISSGIILFLLAAYWIYKRFFYVLKVKLPSEVAFEKLHSFVKEDYGSPKNFYITLTDILKEYFQELYEKPFVGMTDDEMMHFLEKMSAVSQRITEKVKEILDGVTLVKFANQRAAQEQMSKALSLAIKIIEETTLEEH